METVVLPAQDHLAQERYRQNSRGMSGMIYPLGGPPRTRKKVRSPDQVFIAASLRSEVAALSSEVVALSSARNVRETESARSGLVSPMDMSLGVLRSAPSSASNSHLPPLAVLKTPQYRLNSTGFISHESSAQQQQKKLASSSPVPAVDGVLAGSRLSILRSRSDGDRPLDLKKAFEEAYESSKSSQDRKVVKSAENLSDRRKGWEKRTVAEAKAAAVTNKSQAVKSGSVPKKAGVITILQRPQTKEAAAENIALFTGKPIEDVTKQVVKSAQIVSETQKLVADIKLGSIANEESNSGRNVSPKRLAKKKTSRDGVTKVASRVSEPDPRRTREVLSDGESRRSETVKLLDVVKVVSRRRREYLSDGDTRKTKTGSSGKDAGRPPEVLERRRSSAAVLSTDTRRSAKEFTGGEANVDEAKKVEEKATVLNCVSVGQFVSSLSSHDDALTPSASNKSGSSGASGEVGQGQALSDPNLAGISRSSSFRSNSRGSTESSVVELFFLPSSPQRGSERWAGPAYTNSPPPSTLPFPTFPLQRVKSCLTEATLAADVVLSDAQDSNSDLSSSPPSPRSVGSFSFFASAMQSPFVDPLSATKDLRRILNLDVSACFESSTDYGSEDVATQSLKRMLQLD